MPMGCIYDLPVALGAHPEKVCAQTGYRVYCIYV